jgi:hypothetical protein
MNWLAQSNEEIIMRKLKMFGTAFALASAAFVLTMLKNPPKSVAFNPGATIQPLDIKISSGIPTGDYGAVAN